jgi:hypothetical protein
VAIKARKIRILNKPKSIERESPAGKRQCDHEGAWVSADTAEAGNWARRIRVACRQLSSGLIILVKRWHGYATLQPDVAICKFVGRQSIADVVLNNFLVIINIHEA